MDKRTKAYRDMVAQSKAAPPKPNNRATIEVSDDLFADLQAIAAVSGKATVQDLLRAVVRHYKSVMTGILR